VFSLIIIFIIAVSKEERALLLTQLLAIIFFWLWQWFHLPCYINTGCHFKKQFLA